MTGRRWRAARGLAHVGVLEVLEEAKIRVDVISGTSTGAVVGALALATCGTTRVRGALVMPVALSCAATSALFIFAPWLALSLVVLGIAGFLRAVLSSLTTTALHTIVPDTFRGRVMAI